MGQGKSKHLSRPVRDTGAQTHVVTLDGTLRAMCERWYPGLANDNQVNTERAAMA